MAEILPEHVGASPALQADGCEEELIAGLGLPIDPQRLCPTLLAFALTCVIGHLKVKSSPII